MDYTKYASYAITIPESFTPRLPILFSPTPHRRTQSICKNGESRYILSNSINETPFKISFSNPPRAKKPRLLKSLHIPSISEELTQALKNIIPLKKTLKNITLQIKPKKTKIIAISSLMSRKAEEVDIRGFIQSLFSHEPSPFRKMGFTLEPEALDIRAADKILQDAKKIIKHGVVKKSSQHENVTQIEEFWKNQISREKCVRWDLFEEGLLCFLECFMVCSYGALRKVNWKTFFRKLYLKLSCEIDDFSFWPPSPSMPIPPKYPLKLVKYSDFAKFVSDDELYKLMLACLEEFPSYIENLRKGPDFTYSCGCFYKGEWKDGRKEGAGNMEFCSGDCYSGTFNRGLREDFGNLTSEHKYFYKGDFKRDKFHGYGKIKFPDGSSFEGLWIKNYFSNGMFEYGDGGFYQGEWVGYSFEGKGKLQLVAGVKKKGMWREGKLCGEGKITEVNGKKIKGFFVDDVLQDDNDGIVKENTVNEEIIEDNVVVNLIN